MSTILGIESSCDETAASVVDDGRTIRSNVIASQNDLHAKYGGVVPEIASRAHLQRIAPVIEEALAQAHATWRDLDAVAVGNRPGLIGSLLVGVSAAKALAWSLQKPLIGVDHIRAHLYAATMTPPTHSSTPDTGHRTPDKLFPALGLVVSGGHTVLYRMASPLDMLAIGRTIDDAVGEAYDKAAVILQLGFPGGPRLDKLAQTGDPTAETLPRSMLGKDSLDFSFSGLKTAMLYAVRGVPTGRGPAARFEHSADDLTDKRKADLAAAFQSAAIETVIIKIRRAIDTMTDSGTSPRSLLIGGGVSANSLLRRRATELGSELGITVCLPPMSLCLDNAAMIAGLAFHHLNSGRSDDLTLPAIATTTG